MWDLQAVMNCGVCVFGLFHFSCRPVPKTGAHKVAFFGSGAVEDSKVADAGEAAKIACYSVTNVCRMQNLLPRRV